MSIRFRLLFEHVTRPKPHGLQFMERCHGHCFNAPLKLWLGSLKSYQPMVILLLDFGKAYHRVEWFNSKGLWPNLASHKNGFIGLPMLTFGARSTLMTPTMMPSTNQSCFFWFYGYVHVGCTMQNDKWHIVFLSHPNSELAMKCNIF